MFEDIKEGLIYKNLNNGNWIINTNEFQDIVSPVDNTIVGRVPCMTISDATLTILNAKKAQKSWGNTPVSDRSKILHKASQLLLQEKDYISNIIVKEIGKNRISALNEIERTAEYINYAADAGKHMEEEAMEGEGYASYSKNKYSYIIRVPVGVVLAISPFNYPVNLSCSKIAPALIAGNSVILKPPTQGSISALHLCKIFHEAGIPKGVLNTITCKSNDIGDFLVTNENINFINFTGSTKIGMHISKIAKMVPLLLELGGKDAAIVLPDADLNNAAKEIVKGAFDYSGQRCTAVKRVITTYEIEDKLIKLITDNVKKLKVGSPEDNADIVPLINSKAADFVEDLVKDAIKNGAHEIMQFKREGNLIYPTVLKNVTTKMRVAFEEPFGPILPIMAVKNINEAIDLANSTNYGLQASVFTKDIDNAFNIAKKLEVGTVQINGKTERGPDSFPFTGFKSSGLGTQGIKYSINAMTKIKNIVLNIRE